MQGRNDWFKDFFYAHYANLCRVAYGYLNDKDSGEDIVQECFTKFWEHYQKKEIANPPAYILTMVRNACITGLKKSRQTTLLEEDVASVADSSVFPLEPEVKPEVSAVVNEVLTLLPEKCRMIFKMSRLQNKTYQQIADELQLSVKTIENQMGKAIKIIRQYVSDHPGYFIYALVFFVFNA